MLGVFLTIFCPELFRNLSDNSMEKWVFREAILLQIYMGYKQKQLSTKRHSTLNHTKERITFHLEILENGGYTFLCDLHILCDFLILCQLLVQKRQRDY